MTKHKTNTERQYRKYAITILQSFKVMKDKIGELSQIGGDQGGIMTNCNVRS